VIGGVVITFGVTFLAMLTAIVTSAFISAEEQDARLQELEREEAVEAELRRMLANLDRRLDRIEAMLAERR
jgi:type II secretory pathway component PulJ